MNITPRLVLTALAALALACPALTRADDERPVPATKPLPAGLIALQSPEGTRLFETSAARTNFFALIQHFVSQQKSSYCGVASAVTVMNTLRPANTPLCATLNNKIAWFDQSNYFNTNVEQVIPRSVVDKQGFTLQEWRGAIATYGVKAEAWHCGTNSGQADYTNFLARAKAALTTPDHYLVVNFSRKTLAQSNGGHFSPIGAYNEAADKFLVLDVAAFNWPAFWVDSHLLWDAMNTVDNVSKTNRGFVVLSN